MIVLTAEQHQAIEDAGGQPVRVEDPESRTTYVLLNVELYERIRTLVESDDSNPEEFLPLIWDAMKGDWDDPSMDIYDRLLKNR
jgi:hypothetical protein